MSISHKPVLAAEPNGDDLRTNAIIILTNATLTINMVD